MSAQKRIGILGGTFDPIHNAHLALGEVAFRQFGLDEVVFMPAGEPPHKTDRTVSPAADRAEMVRLAIRDYPAFSCSEFELNLPGKSYTAQTLTALHRERPDARYYFILGGDSLFALDEWYEPEVILRHAVILAAAREDHDVSRLREQIAYLTGKFGGQIELLRAPLMEVSSSRIRDRIRQGRSIAGLTPPAVEEYIYRNGLYRENLPGEEELAALKERLSHTLSEHRYAHTLGVAETAAHLASVYGAEESRAYLAGLLHDCAKNCSDEALLSRCRQLSLPVSPAEEMSPQLLHARYGAWLAEHEYGVKDSEILDAIRSHTTGRPGMGLLEKIVFAADYLEPGRNQAPQLKILRRLAEKDLDLTVLRILQDTLDYLRRGGKPVDPATEKTYRWMLEQTGEGKTEVR